MKKVLGIVLALALVVSLSVTAFAADSETGLNNRNQQMNGQPPMMGGQAPGMNGQPPMMDGESPDMNGQPPMMGSEAPDMNGQPPMMNGQAPGGASAFIDFDAMAENGIISEDTCSRIKAYMEENRPDDLLEMNGEAPNMNGEAPNMNAQSPEMNGQPPMMDGEAPDGGSPAGMPERPEGNGEEPEFGGEELMVNGLLKDLLEAGIITQAEYDAIAAAL